MRNVFFYFLYKQCDLLKIVRTDNVKMGQENVTKQKRIVTETIWGHWENWTTVLARVLAAVFLSDYVTQKTEHAGKLKPFGQRVEKSGYVTRKTEHGGRLKPPHRSLTLDERIRTKARFILPANANANATFWNTAKQSQRKRRRGVNNLIAFPFAGSMSQADVLFLIFYFCKQLLKIYQSISWGQNN